MKQEKNNDPEKRSISGFSRMSKSDKLRWIADQYFDDPGSVKDELQSFWHQDGEQQRILDGFSENTISNFILPFGVAPNFLINGKYYCVPMVIEESSVVAAASSAAKYWMNRGGIHTEVLGTRKVGQVHFSWQGSLEKLRSVFPELKKALRSNAAEITANMEKRGGGIDEIRLLDFNHIEPNYYQLLVMFETCDSMGANFINSVLENFGSTLEVFIAEHPDFNGSEGEVDIIMAILSNYTPECVVRAWVECPMEQLGINDDNSRVAEFAYRFEKAVRIAHIDPYRATTHNKGIFNGIDAVVLATGNDFRAVEACGHSYAARSGQYKSLSDCRIENGVFKFWLEVPLAIGTVGGLTRLHPIARRSLELLGNPNAEELMQIIAATGLAQNFAAVRSLVTTGIQAGHMKMHLMNILNHLGATPEEIEICSNYFKDRAVSFSAVREFLHLQRNTGNKAGKIKI